MLRTIVHTLNEVSLFIFAACFKWVKQLSLKTF